MPVVTFTHKTPCLCKCLTQMLTVNPSHGLQCPFFHELAVYTTVPSHGCVATHTLEPPTGAVQTRPPASHHHPLSWRRCSFHSTLQQPAPSAAMHAAGCLCDGARRWCPSCVADQRAPGQYRKQSMHFLGLSRWTCIHSPLCLRDSTSLPLSLPHANPSNNTNNSCQ